MAFHTKRCATRLPGKISGTRRCKRTARLMTPGDWWHCWQHEQPGQIIHLWGGCHPRDLSIFHYWFSQDGMHLRLCDGDNTEDAPPPTHDAAEGAQSCDACQEIWLSGLDRFWSHWVNDFGDVSNE